MSFNFGFGGDKKTTKSTRKTHRQLLTTQQQKSYALNKALEKYNFTTDARNDLCLRYEQMSKFQYMNSDYLALAIYIRHYKIRYPIDVLNKLTVQQSNDLSEKIFSNEEIIDFIVKIEESPETVLIKRKEEIYTYLRTILYFEFLPTIVESQEFKEVSRESDESEESDDEGAPDEEFEDL